MNKLFNFPDELKFLEKFTSDLFPEQSKISLLRIILWGMFFLICAHVLAPSIEPALPHGKRLEQVGITALASTPSDPRYTRLDIKKVPDNSIIWVGGSSLAVKEEEEGENYTFLPSLVSTGANQYLSIKMASRLLDTYTMALDAIEREPDALFIALNPFWLANDQSAFFKTNLMNRGTQLWATPYDWQLIPLLSSPGNVLWAMAGSHHNVVANGYDYLREIMPAGNKTKKKKAAAKTQKKLSYNKPLLFWISQRYDTQTDYTSFDARQWQLKAMEQNDTSSNFFAQKMLRNLLENIKESGIPTFLYLAPTDYKLAETSAVQNLRAVQAQFVSIASQYESDNIRLVRIPFSTYDSLVFRDYLHLSDSGNLTNILSSEINMVMEEQ